MPRLLFDSLTERISRRRFDPSSTNWLEPADVLTYVYLTAEYHRCRSRYSEKGSFYLSLGELQRASGIRDVYRRISRLNERYRFNGGHPLFKYGGFRKIEFSDWKQSDEES